MFRTKASPSTLVRSEIVLADIYDKVDFDLQA